MNCRTCRFYDNSSTGGPDHGECHRYAPKPRVASLDGPQWAVWPLVGDTDGCGEWVSAETAPPIPVKPPKGRPNMMGRYA